MGREEYEEVSGGRYFGEYLVWEARIKKEELVGKEREISCWSWQWRETKRRKK